MVQINIKQELLDDIKVESNRTGVKMFKLIEFAWDAYKKKLKLGSINEAIIKGRDDLQKELTQAKFDYDKLKVAYNRVNGRLTKINKKTKTKKK